MYVNSVSPTQFFHTRQYHSRGDIDLSIFQAALCYQGYQLAETKNMILPIWPQKTEYLTKLCGSSSIGSEDAFGYIIQSTSSIYLAFRGTISLTDWTANIDARKIPFPYVPNSGEVHKGFNSIYSSMRNTILKKLRGLKTNKTLYITGHSLGGALATLCALDVAVNSNFHQPIITTFAAPRVGNEKFVNKFNATINKSIRVINSQDHAPSVPPPEFGFTHVKGGLVIDVFAGSSTVANHSITTGYFPGLVKLDPLYAQKLCTRNPAGFCPPSYQLSSVYSYPFQQFC